MTSAGTRCSGPSGSAPSRTTCSGMIMGSRHRQRRHRVTILATCALRGLEQSPLLLPGAAALELPVATERPGYPLALTVSAVLASFRADVTGAEEPAAGQPTQTHRKIPRTSGSRRPSAPPADIATTTGAFADAARLAEQPAGLARAGSDLADASVELAIAVAARVLASDAPGAIPLAQRSTRARPPGPRPGPHRQRLLAAGLAVAGTEPGQSRASLRESRGSAPRRLPERPGPAVGDRDHLSHQRPGHHARARPPGHSPPAIGRDRLRIGLVLHMVAGALAAPGPLLPRPSRAPPKPACPRRRA